MRKYNPKKIEKKWQNKWYSSDVFKAKDSSGSKKFYVLVEFPYPSGEGLHVGHCRSYIGLDVIARKKRLEGFNVLFPMGWDAFGLPTENYAIKTGIHPAAATLNNTDKFRKQQKRIGLSFDFSREINTSDPLYYKWTQWIFIQLFKKGLSYKAKMDINWCPSCKIGLANEEVLDGKCERCGFNVVKKEKEQWLIKITEYAQRLIDDLGLVDYPERVKIGQKEWIGKSQGLEVKFKISKTTLSASVFTTRIDTLFGCTYLVLAPEHQLIEKLKDRIKNYRIVKSYIEKAKSKLERERISEIKEKTGVELIGIKAVNPANGKEIPVFVADYVLINYGTGAIMAVPAHDKRDFDFAKRYNLSIIEVIRDNKGQKFDYDKAYEGEGFLVNSERFSGMDSKRAKDKIAKWLSNKGLAENKVYYKLRDWIFSRQRYWGEPIPIIYCSYCWEKKLKKEKDEAREGYDYIVKEGIKYEIIPVEEKDLPLVLPEVKEYKPTEKGESPLAKNKDFLEVKCPKCQKQAQRETDVMPNWAGSNWYYLRYCDPYNNNELAGKKPLSYWMPVDWYNGGMEHTTLHLLYSRFIYKFLWDIGVVPKSIGPEPYRKRTSHGMILGEKMIKMSKSKGNVINPDEVINKYGADALRVYEMFIGPFEQAAIWDTKGIVGIYRFLQRVYKLPSKIEAKDSELKRLLHKTIKKVSLDIDSLKFNTAVSALMEFINKWHKEKTGLDKDDFKKFLIILSVFAPHISEELWEESGFKGLCFSQKWPKHDEEFIREDKVLLIVQINGKVRDKIEVGQDISEDNAKETVLKTEKVNKWMQGKKIKKIIFVKNKLINIVV
ncbi:MAG: leucine--tRNA ligase [Candidatus Pacebacteria bacterium]|nr:leucine--tRNA ligase [Candidatus Paceibacterota bacterium]